jgi:hypothetical protein
MLQEVVTSTVSYGGRLYPRHSFTRSITRRGVKEGSILGQVSFFCVEGIDF